MHCYDNNLPQAVVDVLKFYTATTGESSSETKFMTVSKKIGKNCRKLVSFEVIFFLRGQYDGTHIRITIAVTSKGQR